MMDLIPPAAAPGYQDQHHQDQHHQHHQDQHHQDQPTLLTLRLEARMSQADVAAAAGITRQTYTVVEGSKRAVALDTILAICAVFNRTPGQIANLKISSRIYKKRARRGI